MGSPLCKGGTGGICFCGFERNQHQPRLVAGRERYGALDPKNENK
jgi:hypothetical protein